jgi:putative FmdB family regulatory protein
MRLSSEVVLPLYEYRCRKCGRHLEKIQKFSDPPLATCVDCGGRLERLLSPPALRFKGSGWYVTDYARKPSPAEGTKAETSSTQKDESPSAGGTGGSPSTEAKKPAEPSPAKKPSNK